MRNLGRVITAMITPFNEDGSVDYEGAVALARHLVDHGSEGLLVGGTTGEGATMTTEEKLRLYREIVDAVGDRAAIIGNTGTVDTRATIEFTHQVEETGVDAALVICPFYVKPTQEGLFQHFKAVADSTRLPILIYNVPGRTCSNILPATIRRLTDVCPNIVGIKDAAGKFDQVTEERRILPKDFLIYSGDDSFTLAIMACGGAGVISVASHVIGDDLLAMIEAFEQGQVERARELHLKMFPIMKGLFFITSPIPVKTAVNLLGLPGGHFRLPMVEPTEEEREHVRRMLTDYGFKV
jgi:4-hydroxy-tetrahydrodipicolinate synthase